MAEEDAVLSPTTSLEKEEAASNSVGLVGTSRWRYFPNGTPFSQIAEAVLLASSQNVGDDGGKERGDDDVIARESGGLAGGSRSRCVAAAESSSSSSTPAVARRGDDDPVEAGSLIIENVVPLSVASFNLLAPAYVRPVDRRTGEVQKFAAFEWVDDYDGILNIENRGERLVDTILRADADVVCLQELQLEKKRRRRTYDDGIDDKEGNVEEKDESLARDDSFVANDDISCSSKLFQLPDWICRHYPSRGPTIEELYDVCLPSDTELTEMADRNARVLGVEDAPVTCAVLYKKDRLVRVDDFEIEGDGDGDEKADGKDKPKKKGKSRHHKGGKANRNVNKSQKKKDSLANTTTCVSVCLRGKPGSSALAAMTGPIVLTSVHLDATDEKKRVKQMSKCVEKAAAIFRRLRPQNWDGDGDDGEAVTNDLDPISMIVAGDMNTECETGSCVSAFLAPTSSATCKNALPSEEDYIRECAAALRLGKGESPSQSQLVEWKELHEEARTTIWDCCASLDRVRTGTTRCGYDHDDEVGEGTTPKMRQWRLDHIFYSPTRMVPIAAWSTLEADPESCRTGLPNKRMPSDHLPVGALFYVRKEPARLCPQEHELLLRRTRDIEVTHEKQLLEGQRHFDNDIADLEAQLGLRDESSSCDGDRGNQKKKQKKKGSPPKEIVHLMRQKRSTLREIKAKQIEERRAFVEGLGDLQRLLIEHKYGCTAREWVNRGSIS